MFILYLDVLMSCLIFRKVQLAFNAVSYVKANLMRFQADREELKERY